MLRKLAPAIVTVWPAEPLEGLKEEITGGPVGATAAVVEVEVGVVPEDGAGTEVAVRLPPPVPGLVDGWRAGAAVVGAERVAVGGEDAGPAINETSRAMAAAATRAPTAATEPISQRLGPVGGGLAAGVPGWVTGTDTAGSEGPVEACPRDGVGGGSGATPADSRARRTALSMAPRAR